MFGIIAINRGMWGITSWVTENRQIVLFNTMEEAEDEAERLYKLQGPVNRFTDYFACEYDEA